MTDSRGATVSGNGHDLTQVDSLYTSLPEAVDETTRRRSNVALCATVDEFHRSLPPSFLPSSPFATLFRPIVTPNHEFAEFMAISRRFGLRPLCVEYAQDIFRAQNRDKYRLCRPAFKVRHGQTRSMRLVDFGQKEGQPLSRLTTTNGWNLARYHHTLLEQSFPDAMEHIIDFSSWFAISRNAEFYYLRYLSLFICHGILFENFVTTDAEEMRFTRERVLPSFARAEELFGVKPLIVPVVPRAQEADDHWRCHPGSLRNFALGLLRQQP